MTRWLAFVALVACSKPKQETAPQVEVTACAKVADHLVSLMSGAQKHPPEATDPLRRAVDKRCTEDKWSADTTQCLLALTSLADGEKCQAMMTPAQVDAFQRDTEAATTEMRGQFVEPAPVDDGVTQSD